MASAFGSSWGGRLLGVGVALLVAALPLRAAGDPPREDCGECEEGKVCKEGECRCPYVTCFDLCCDKGQVCAHGAEPGLHKCLRPPHPSPPRKP